VAFISLDTNLILPGKAVKSEIFTTLNGNVEDLNTRLTTVEGGANKYVVFDGEIRNASSSSSVTGVVHWKSVVDFRVTNVTIQIFEKGLVTSGFLELDVKKNSTPNDVGMVSILTTLPIIDFSTDPDYTSDSGVLDPIKQYITAGDILRLDLTQLPSTPVGRFILTVFGEI
jgi:hypothetical protein